LGYLILIIRPRWGFFFTLFHWVGGITPFWDKGLYIILGLSIDLTGVFSPEFFKGPWRVNPFFFSPFGAPSCGGAGGSNFSGNGPGFIKGGAPLIVGNHTAGELSQRFSRRIYGLQEGFFPWKRGEIQSGPDHI